jgi:hypothetical protein
MAGDEPGAERFFVFVGGMRERIQGSIAGRIFIALQNRGFRDRKGVWKVNLSEAECSLLLLCGRQSQQLHW